MKGVLHFGQREKGVPQSQEMYERLKEQSRKLQSGTNGGNEVKVTPTEIHTDDGNLIADIGACFPHAIRVYRRDCPPADRARLAELVSRAIQSDPPRFCKERVELKWTESPGGRYLVDTTGEYMIRRLPNGKFYLYWLGESMRYEDDKNRAIAACQRHRDERGGSDG